MSPQQRGDVPVEGGTAPGGGHRLAVHVFDSERALGRRLAAEILGCVQERRARGRTFVLGCPSGRSARSTYLAMAELAATRDDDLSGLVVVMMDDYLEPDGDRWRRVDPQAHHSCARFARQEIQGVLNAGLTAPHRVRDANVWLPDPDDPAAYDRQIAEAGGIDLFVLASGAGDGHVAFNPPGTAHDARTRIVALAEQTRRDNLATFPDFAGIDDVPTHGVSVGTGTIVEQSRDAVLIAVGADKRTAVRRLTSGTGYDPEWPATVARLIPGARLYLDRAAAAVVGGDPG